MIQRITLQNFMAHKATVIEPAHGLTVLVGPNNCGKSAVVEALQALATNSGKEFMVRHGENDCRIIIETSEGHCIEWRRKSGTVSYLLNGSPAHRMRGAVPDDLDKLLKLPEVEGPDGKDSFAVHFGSQKEPIFLLDRSGRHTAMFFASSSDASRLVAMQAAHKRKVADRRGEERTLEQRELQLSRSLQSLQPVPQLMESLQKLESEHDNLQAEATAIKEQDTAMRALGQQLEAATKAREEVSVLMDLPAPPSLVDTTRLEHLLASARAGEAAIAHQTERGHAIRTLNTPPVMEDPEDLESTCIRLAGQVDQVEYQAAKARCLSPLKNPPALERTEPLEDICERLRSQSADAARLGSRAQVVLNIPALPTLSNLDALADDIKALSQAAGSVAAAKNKLSALAKIPTPVELPDPGPLARVVSALRDAQARAREETADLNNAAALLNETALAIRKWAATHPDCPVCGAPIDPDRFLTERGHGHA
jgi:exonuclease SbcC